MRGRPWFDVDRGAGAALVCSAAGLLGTAGLPAARRERRAADDGVCDFALSTMVSEYGLTCTERILPGGHSHSLVAVGSVPWLPWAASLAL